VDCTKDVELFALVELGPVDGHVLQDQFPVGVVEHGQTRSSSKSSSRSDATNTNRRNGVLCNVRCLQQRIRDPR